MKIGKKILRKIYYLLQNAANELEDEELYRRLGGRGENSYIRRPNVIRQPEQVFIGDNVTIDPSCAVQCVNYGDKVKPKIVLGNNVGFRRGTVVVAANDIVFENGVSVARNVYISNANHAMEVDGVEYGDQPVTGGRILIKEGAWIGNGSTILGGQAELVIGQKSIVGAGSIVKKSVPDYTIVAGNPAKVIKQWDFELKEWKRV